MGFMDLFKRKKKINLSQVAGNLVSFAMDPRDIELSLKKLPVEVEVDRKTVEYELTCLRLFAVDVGINQAFGSDPVTKEALSNAYMGCLDSVIKDFPDDLGSTFHDALGYRFDKYVELCRNHPDDEPFSIIATFFAALCENPKDIKLLTFGKMMFLSTMNGAAEYLQSIEIEDPDTDSP